MIGQQERLISVQKLKIESIVEENTKLLTENRSFEDENRRLRKLVSTKYMTQLHKSYLEAIQVGSEIDETDDEISYRDFYLQNISSRNTTPSKYSDRQGAHQLNPNDSTPDIIQYVVFLLLSFMNESSPT